MPKILTTQLIGKIQQIFERENESIEYGARLLAQALVGEGDIYFYGEEELSAVYQQAVYGLDKMPGVKRLEGKRVPHLTSADRVAIFARTPDDPSVLAIAKQLYERQIPFLAVCGRNGEGTELEDFAHVYISLHLEKGLVPMEGGNRTGYPHLLLALYVYHMLLLVLNEMMDEEG